MTYETQLDAYFSKKPIGLDRNGFEKTQTKLKQVIPKKFFGLIPETLVYWLTAKPEIKPYDGMLEYFDQFLGELHVRETRKGLNVQLFSRYKSRGDDPDLSLEQEHHISREEIFGLQSKLA